MNRAPARAGIAHYDPRLAALSTLRDRTPAAAVYVPGPCD